MYLDRKGKPITLWEWAELSEDPSYRIIRHDMIMGNSFLSTIWLGIPSIESLFGGPPCIFETMRFLVRDDGGRKVVGFPSPEDGTITHQVRYVTEEEAYQGHLEILRRIRETEMT